MVVISSLGLANKLCASLGGNYCSGESYRAPLLPDPLDRWDTQKQKVLAYGNVSAEQPGEVRCLAAAGEIGREEALLRPSPLDPGHRRNSLEQNNNDS